MHADGRESEGVEHYRRDPNRRRRSVIARAGYFTTIRDARNHRPAIQLHVEWKLSFAVAAFIAGTIRNLGFNRTAAACPDNSTGVALHTAPGTPKRYGSAMPVDNHPPHLSSWTQWACLNSLMQSGRAART